jgi:hypothetical protein
MSKRNKNKLEFTIKYKKLQQFQEWCQENQVNPQEILDKFIDYCLEDHEIIKSLLIDTNNNFNLEQKIQFYLETSLQPLIKRIEQLETQNNQFSTHENIFSITDLVTPTIPHTVKEKVDESQITYLPRNQVWQRLKQTDYIKYSGYDNFLKAKGDEFIDYGIFFDSHKKRYYVFNENQ